MLAIVLAASIARGQNLVRNGSFERFDDAGQPVDWSVGDAAKTLQFTGQHHHGANSAMLVGDGAMHTWSQRIDAPALRSFRLSAFVCGEKAIAKQPEDLILQATVRFKDRPTTESLAIQAVVPQGDYGWREIVASAKPEVPAPIESITVTVGGSLISGRVMFDQVTLTEDRDTSPRGLLLAKVDDLLAQLDRVGDVDETVAQTRQHLLAAKAGLPVDAPDLDRATSEWTAAAASLSHKAWAAMFPDAMTDKAVEARMIYHGHGPTKADCDRYLDVLTKANANGCFLSLGTWASAVYKSDLLPCEPEYDKDDTLAYFIAEAHKRDIKVFGYIAALYGSTSPPRHPDNIYSKHPEWFAKPGPDAAMPTFPDAANPEVVKFISSVYVELISKYKIDGVGLDYLRYPTVTSLNFDERNRQAIQSRYGFDILAGDPWQDADKAAKLYAYRADVLSNLVTEVRRATQAVRPDVKLVGCLVADPHESVKYGQDWAKLTPLFDYVTPLNYDDVSADADLVARQRALCDAGGTTFIAAIGGMPDVHASWTISTWANRVAIQRKAGSGGMILYRIAELDPAVASFFGNGPYFGQAAFPIVERDR